MEDKIIVASYLVIGLTEQDLHNLRKILYAYGNIFLGPGDRAEDVLSVQLVNDKEYPCIALFVDDTVWERFTASHDMVEFSLVMNQDNILGALH